MRRWGSATSRQPALPRFCVMVEVVAGYVMLSGFISILANKVARLI